MNYIKRFIFVRFFLKLIKINKNLSYKDLNFKKLDFTNYTQIKLFIFKRKFYTLNNKYVDSFDFLNFSKNLGGKIGINLSRNTIFDWYKINKNKINYPWSDDLTSRRLKNLIYNYEFINSSSSAVETKLLDKIIFYHMKRVIYDFKNKKINELTSYDLLAFILSIFIINKKFDKNIKYIETIIKNQIDLQGFHRSYNVVEHAKFVNNLNEIKNIFLYFNHNITKNIEEIIIKMTSIINQYFHLDGSIPLFNGSNNNYTNIIYDSLNKDEYFINRDFTDIKNGIALYADKNKKIFFEVVQPNNDNISKTLSAGTLSLEFSAFGEKIITNCGASETLGKNPEYLRYSAAHSTIILQNTNISEIRENTPHIKYPQSVDFVSNKIDDSLICEGSHNGYLKKFSKIVKRKLKINERDCKIYGEDSIISSKYSEQKLIYHIRFHLNDGLSYNFTNNKKNVILKSKSDKMWLFKSDTELDVEDSILVDNNTTLPTKQIVIKGFIKTNKLLRTWSIEKI